MQTPKEWEWGFHDAITYASYGDENLLLDLHYPEGKPGPNPGLVIIPGGHWHDGDRKEMQLYARYLASKGFVVASIDHRFYSKHIFPAALHDAKAAVRWLRANAQTYGIDPSRIGAVGAGSGGHLAGLLGTTAGLAEFEGEANPGYSSGVQAVAAFHPAMDLVALYDAHGEDAYVIECVRLLLGAGYRSDPDLWAHASPINHVGSSSAPFLFLHGTEASPFLFEQSAAMEEALAQAGVHAEIFAAEGAGGILNAGRWITPANEAMNGFFNLMFK